MTEDEKKIEDYEIEEEGKPITYEEYVKDVFDMCDSMLKDADDWIDRKLAEYGLSPDQDLSDADGDRLARSMLDGTLDDTLAYIKKKYCGGD